MSIDALFIEFVHALCVHFGGFLTPFFRLISILGEKSWFFLLIALLLCMSKKTRWVGVTIILSIFASWIIADFGIKPIVMRERPYNVSKLYQDYWVLAGSYPETDYSMPSGHVLGVAAFFVSLYISCKKEWRKNVLILGIISVVLMILSRTYFMHHHLTDCLVAVVLSFVISFTSKFIVKNVYSFIKKNEKNPLCNFILNFDLYERFING